MQMKTTDFFNRSCVMLFMAVILTASPVLAQSSASGDKRTVAPYHNLEIEGAFTVTLVQGNEEAVFIEAAPELAEEIMIKVDEETLKIYSRKHSKITDKISLTVHFKNLKSIDCSGAIMLSGTGPFAFDELSLDMSGACKATLEINSASLHVDISGAGNASLSGKVPDVSLDVSGSGKFMASELLADDYQIDISGAGIVVVNAAKSMDVDVSGSGNLKYSGDPKINKEISGSGRVVKM